MTNTLFNGSIILSLGLVFSATMVHSGAPLLTIKPLSATRISIPANDSATVSYQITNLSRKTHQLMMKAIPGVVPIISPTGCSSLFTLSHKQSCRLDLSINGSALTQPILGGPSICNQANPNLCYQPSKSNSLHITQTPAVNYTIGGSVFGLSGTLTLINNANEVMTLMNDGSFAFTNPLPPGSTYQVSVQQQPITQTCTVSNPGGMITNANVTNVVVNCSVNQRQVGGNVTGLTGSESLVLKNNAMDYLTITSNGGFTFPSIAQGANYQVSVDTQPSTQTCTVVNGNGTAGGSDITNIQVNCSTNAYSVGGNVSGLSGTLELQNNGGDNLILTNNGNFSFTLPVANSSPYAVSIANQPATQTCSVSQGNGTISGANVTNVSINCVANTTTLSASVSQLALSVTGLTEYGMTPTTSGLARKITISNTGANTALNLSITPPLNWPSGTSSSTNCNTTLSSGSSCTITITPGNTATSDGTNPCSQARTAPIPQVIQISAANADSIPVNVVVLNYGCIYQGGFVYAFDDTTPDTSSVGGKVVSMSDQSTSMIWSSNGMSSASNRTSDDLLPGIDTNSTSSVGSPSYSDFTSFFSSSYTNTPIPFNSSSFLQCEGKKNGVCNTRNIWAFYNTLKTNNTKESGGSAPFTASAGPTNPSFYAAGLCQQTINGYSDWYLPAICEMGYDDQYNPIDSGCGSSALTSTLQNIQLSLIDMRYAGSPSPLFFYYWSSSLMASPNNDLVAIQGFTPSNGSQIMDSKNQRYRVRCSRLFTP